VPPLTLSTWLLPAQKEAVAGEIVPLTAATEFIVSDFAGEMQPAGNLAVTL
jgi:hypothetical protein